MTLWLGIAIGWILGIITILVYACLSISSRDSRREEQILKEMARDLRKII